MKITERRVIYFRNYDQILIKRNSDVAMKVRNLYNLNDILVVQPRQSGGRFKDASNLVRLRFWHRWR